MKDRTILWIALVVACFVIAILAIAVSDSAHGQTSTCESSVACLTQYGLLVRENRNQCEVALADLRSRYATLEQERDVLKTALAEAQKKETTPK